MQANHEVRPWITYEEAQRLTSLGRTTIWRIVSTGEVETAKVGRAVRINRESLMAYMRRATGGTGFSLDE